MTSMPRFHKKPTLIDQTPMELEETIQMHRSMLTNLSWNMAKCQDDQHDEDFYRRLEKRRKDSTKTMNDALTLLRLRAESAKAETE